MTYSQTSTLPNGMAAAPGLAFDSEPSTGFFRPAAGQVGIAVGGVEVASFDANGHRGGLVVAERTFVETTGAGTYTATVAIPAGAWLMDLLWLNTALWTAASSATLDVGDDDDPDGMLDGINLKSAPAADLAISYRDGDTGVGDDSAAFGPIRYYAAAKTITATVVTVGASGAAGRSRLVVVYATPAAVAAVKA